MVYFIQKGKKAMDLFKNVYILMVKNKVVISQAALFLISMISKKIVDDDKSETSFLGDNLPFRLGDQIRNA